MRVSIVETQEIIYKEKEAFKAVLPAADGEMCVFDFHEQFIVRLIKGRIILDDVFFLNMKNGIARMKSNELIIMIER